MKGGVLPLTERALGNANQVARQAYSTSAACFLPVLCTGPCGDVIGGLRTKAKVLTNAQLEISLDKHLTAKLVEQFIGEERRKSSIGFLHFDTSNHAQDTERRETPPVIQDSNVTE